MSLSNLCRLCVNYCPDGKNLYHENGGLPNALYEIIFHLFHPKILNLNRAKHLRSICNQCWHKITEFHSFQAMIIVAQLQLITEDRFENSEEYGFSERTDIQLDFKVEEEFISIPIQMATCKKLSSSATEAHDCLQPGVECNLDIKEDIEDIAGAGIRESYAESVNLDISDNIEKGINNSTSIKEISTESFKLSRQKQIVNESYSMCKPMGEQDIIQGSPYSPEFGEPTGNVFKAEDEVALPSFVDKTVLIQSQIKSSGVNETVRTNLIKFQTESSKKNEANGKNLIQCQTESSGTNESEKTNLIPSLSKSSKINEYDGTHIKQAQTESSEAKETEKRNIIQSQSESSATNQTEKTNKIQYQTESSVAKETEKTKLIQSQTEISEAKETEKTNIIQSQTKSSKFNESSHTASSSKVNEALQHLDELVAKWIPSIKCEVCPELFSKYSLYRQHFRLLHPYVEFNLSCCGYKLRVQSKIVEHMMFHDDPESFKCNLCGKCMTNNFILRSHLRKHHPETQDKGFVCQTCGQKYTTRRGLSFHYTKSHEALKRAKHIPQPDGTTVYSCEDCEYTSQFYKRFQNHRWFAHSPRNGYTCDVCGKGFKLASLLRDHVGTHTGMTHYQCPICQRSLKNYSSFSTHLRRVHTEDSSISTLKGSAAERRVKLPYSCQFCSMSYRSKGSLSTHQKRKHNKVMSLEKKRPDIYSCSICSASFKCSKRLLQHEKLKHTQSSAAIAKKTEPGIKSGIENPTEPSEGPSTSLGKTSARKKKYISKKFKCKFCTERFPSAEELREHLLSKHEGQGLHKCSACSLEFTYRNALLHHRILAHPAEFKSAKVRIKAVSLNGKRMGIYNCPHCTRSFINRSNFELHSKLSHASEIKDLQEDSTKVNNAE